MEQPGGVVGLLGALPAARERHGMQQRRKREGHQKQRPLAQGLAAGQEGEAPLVAHGLEGARLPAHPRHGEAHDGGPSVGRRAVQSVDQQKHQRDPQTDGAHRRHDGHLEHGVGHAACPGKEEQHERRRVKHDRPRVQPGDERGVEGQVRQRREQAVTREGEQRGAQHERRFAREPGGEARAPEDAGHAAREHDRKRERIGRALAHDAVAVERVVDGQPHRRDADGHGRQSLGVGSAHADLPAHARPPPAPGLAPTSIGHAATAGRMCGMECPADPGGRARREPHREAPRPEGAPSEPVARRGAPPDPKRDLSQARPRLPEGVAAPRERRRREKPRHNCVLM